MLRKFVVFLGVFCLFFTIAPIFTGVRNIGVLLLLLLGIFFSTLGFCWRNIASYKWLRRILVTFTCVGILVVGALSLFMLKQAYLAQPPQNGDVTVIVLGGKVIGNQPSRMLKNRLDKALEYLNDNPEATCIVTGGQGDDEEYPEAQVMAAYLVRNGIDSTRILEEDRSTNTRENLRFSKELMEDETIPVTIVTDSFHQLRASINAESEGLEVYSLSSKTPWGLLPCYWMRDLCGVVLTWMGVGMTG